MLRFFALTPAAAALAFAALAPQATAAEPPAKSFAIPAEGADDSLRAFAEQSGLQLLYSPDATSGVRTNDVHGDYAPGRAIALLLDGTPLQASFDEANHVLRVNRAASPGRSGAPARRAITDAEVSGPETGGRANKDASAVVALSPFVVSGVRDQGYLATSAMSGTRLNTKIEDVPAALSVVTKDQLNDTAAADINDVFMYEVGTEGTYQWTSYTNDRGTLSDDIQANPMGATRVRGLTAANVATNLFPSNLPFDTYNVESLEISRGPNSTIFGIGNTGGTVNVNLAQARLTKESLAVSMRGDSYGGYRGTYDLNVPIVPGHLAIRVLGLYNAQGFTRKPSSDITRRQEAEITVQPLRSTTIRASFESYRDFNNRPNSMTPEDGVSGWIADGKPTYDPLTQTVHFANGTSTGPIAAASEATQLPYAIAPTNTAFTQSPSWYIDGGKIQLAEINQMPSATGTGPNNVGGTQHLLQSSSYYDRYTNNYPLFMTPGITNRALYDWTSINLAAPNFATTRGETTQVQLEQFFLSTPAQTLALQLGWQHQRIATDSRDFLGSFSGGKYEVLVDVDQNLLDGSPNPYFLRPYLGASQPAYNKGWNDSDISRATLAYDLKFTDRPNWMKWLGEHRFTAYTEYEDYDTANLGFKDTLASSEPWMAAAGGNPSSRNSAGYREYLQYYVGGGNGQNVQYGPKAIQESPFVTTLKYYNGAAQQWVTDPNAEYDPYFYANRPSRRLLSTFGGVYQGYLLDDRVIPTIGLRHDFNRTRDFDSAGNPTAATNGFYNTSLLSDTGAYDWVKDKGDTYSQGVVVKPLRWLGLMFNQSDSFSPGSLAYDVFGHPLPDPHGKTRDYGFELHLFSGRLALRAQQFVTTDYGRGSSAINTIVQRADRMDYGTSSGDPGLTQWLATEFLEKNPTWTTDQVNAAVTQAAGVDPTYLAGHINKTHGDQSVAQSKGREVEIEYNPNRYWTMKFTGSQSVPLNATLSGAVQQYLDERMPTWTTIKGPFSGNPWWTTSIGGTGAQTPQSWYTTNVLANLDVAIATQGKRITQTREYHAAYLTRYRLEGLGFTNWVAHFDVGGAVRWESEGSIGYYGAAPDPDGVIRQLDPNRPIWDSPHTYFDANLGYAFAMFGGRIPVRVQLNARNLFEGGHLQTVAVNPDGTPSAFRIIDPREFFLTTTFNL